MSKEFKQTFEKLGIEDNQEEEDFFEIPEKVNTDVKKRSNHNEEIKDDYERMRIEIVKQIDSCSHVTNIMEESIEENPKDKFIARKVETFAQLIKATSDLRKELILLHKATHELLEDDELDEDKINTNLTSGKDIKKILKDLRNANNDFEIVGEQIDA